MSGIVVITRQPADCVELGQRLARCGLTLQPYPVLRVEDVIDDPGWRAVDERAADGADDLWLAMASPRAPHRFADQCRSRGAGSLLALPLAVIGPGTADAAAGAGLEPALVGPGTGDGLASALAARFERPTTVVYVCGRHRRPELPDALAAAGHAVLPVVVYQMRATPPADLPVPEPTPEAVVVTSPRSAALYLDGVGGRPLPCPHWALGPTTRDAAAALGLDCRIPPEPTLESLVEELCRS